MSWRQFRGHGSSGRVAPGDCSPRAPAVASQRFPGRYGRLPERSDRGDHRASPEFFGSAFLRAASAVLRPAMTALGSTFQCPSTFCSRVGRLVPQHGNGVSRSREFAYTSQTLDCVAKEVTNARDSGKGQG